MQPVAAVGRKTSKLPSDKFVRNAVGKDIFQHCKLQSQVWRHGPSVCCVKWDYVLRWQSQDFENGVVIEAEDEH